MGSSVGFFYNTCLQDDDSLILTVLLTLISVIWQVNKKELKATLLKNAAN